MPESDPGPDQERHATRDRPTFLRVVLAVFWSFFGVRGRDLPPTRRASSRSN
jgi:hypothetical protein